VRIGGAWWEESPRACDCGGVRECAVSKFVDFQGFFCKSLHGPCVRGRSDVCMGLD
jgi:hypothetical protein